MDELAELFNLHCLCVTSAPRRRVVLAMVGGCFIQRAIHNTLCSLPAKFSQNCGAQGAEHESKGTCEGKSLKQTIKGI